MTMAVDGIVDVTFKAHAGTNEKRYPLFCGYNFDL